MARTNTMNIKKLINEETKRITTKALFLSGGMKGYMTDFANGLLSWLHLNYTVDVNVIWDDKAMDGSTDTREITVNAGGIGFHSLGKEELLAAIKGVLLHEVGHIYFSDFKGIHEMEKNVVRQRKFALDNMGFDKNELSNLRDLEEFIAQIQNVGIRNALWNCMQNIINIIEDGYVEERIVSEDYFPGLEYEMIYYKQLKYEVILGVEDVLERSADPEEFTMLWRVMSLMLSYSLFSEYKSKKFVDEDVLYRTEEGRVMASLEADIDYALTIHNAQERLHRIFIIIGKMKELFIQYGNYLIDQFGNDPVREKSDLVSGMTKMPEGINSNGHEKSCASGSMGNETKQSAHTDALDTDENSMPKNNKPDDKNGGTANIAQKEYVNETGAADEDNNVGRNKKYENKPDVNKEMDDQAVGSQYAPLSEGRKENRVNGRVKFSERPKPTEKGGEEIKRLLDAEAKKKILKKMETEKQNELQEFAASIDHKDIHKDVDVNVFRANEPTAALYHQYDVIADELLPLSRRLAKLFKKEINKKRKGGKLNNQMIGKTIELRSVLHEDLKVFSRRVLPQGKAKIAVMHLIDQSGSMYREGRIDHARAAEFVLFHFCKELGIPHACYGHCSDGQSVIMDSYAEFRAYDENDKYRIMGIHANGCNRDGLALKYSMEHLLRQNAEKKLLILTSDGLPSDRGYSGITAEEDLASLRTECERRGIIFIAAAIGEDKDVIKRIYGDNHFLDVSALSHFPEMLIGIVKRFL